MKFYFSEYPTTYNGEIKSEKGVLFVRDNWNDFGFHTLFHTYLIDADGGKTEIDRVKIGVNDKTEEIVDTLSYLSMHGYANKVLSSFPDNVFMLGSLDYYEDIRSWIPGSVLQREFFEQTHDIAFDESLFEKVKSLDVIGESLLRGQSMDDIKQLHRYSNGGPKFINFNWEISYRRDEEDLSFYIKNNLDSLLPTNTFVFIGNNGVGKTSLLKDLVIATSRFDNDVEATFLPNSKLRISKNTGWMSSNSDTVDKISKLIFVSFSTFDTFSDEFIEAFEKNNNFHFVGNRQKDDLNMMVQPKDIGPNLEVNLEWLFTDSAKEKLFREVMKGFVWDSELENFVDEIERASITADSSSSLRTKIQEKSNRLSSGQKMVLGTIGNLITVAGENTLMLVDEPELYLHPPYVLALTLAISKVAEATDSACIMVTHSAVTLQEIISKNVFHITATDSEHKKISHPKHETFGTNTQTINDEIFGLNIRSTGYYQLIRDIVDNHQDEIQSLLNSGDLGQDALMYLEVLRDDNNV
ncbi:AAA family ATPase [Levilactobacillus brevis]|uniref:AAA family ATPase n=1 Tax=Levilactobacillus brevis TaxID=1580 RepID=UPI001117F37F|nr:AAA family ATPase [Levilactobacillus brevis]QCZ46803.1 Hypothetical protein UCCLB556_1926 [Levilactobacillus brevis]